jgi:hypothetical protein
MTVEERLDRLEVAAGQLAYGLRQATGWRPEHGAVGVEQTECAELMAVYVEDAQRKALERRQRAEQQRAPSREVEAGIREADERKVARG